MAQPEDVSGALRAVWELRRYEERQEWCLGGWYNVVFGVMTALIFASYGVANGLLGYRGPALPWLWLPPVLGAYTALAFATKRALGLPRPALDWRNLAIGTAVFVVLFALLGAAVARGLLSPPDYPAGASVVIGVFYVLLGLVLIREAGAAVFGAAIAAGAATLIAFRAGPDLQGLYGIFVTGGGMVAAGVAMLRGPGRQPPAGAPPEPPSDLAQVRETLHQLRGHEDRLAARERALKAFFASSVLAMAGVPALGWGAATGPGLALLGASAACFAAGLWLRRTGVAHGA